MDKSNPTGEPRRRRAGVLWSGLNRGSAWVYARISGSFLGRFMTGYRHMDSRTTRLFSYAGRHRCTPMSAGRQRIVEAVESSLLFRWLRGLLRGLFMCPTACYGLFGLLFGGVGALAGMIAGLLNEIYTPSVSHYVTLGIIALASLPLMTTNRPMSQTLCGSWLGRLVLVRYLGIPEDRLQEAGAGSYAIAYLPAYLGGIAAAVGSVFVSPLSILLALLLVAVAGMILSYPETGVLLATMSLPFVWLHQNFMMLPAALILVTWISYGIKVLFLHRPIRFGLLDRVMVALGILLAGSCLTAFFTSPRTVQTSLCLLVFFSLYFLIVNLMTTREYIRRGLVGVAVSLAVVSGLACLRLVPVDGLSWLEGSRAGDVIVAGFRNGIEQLSGLWAEHSELYLVLAIPWLYAYLLHTKRLLGRILGGLMICLDLALILMPHSVSAMFCVVGVTALFLLLLDHVWLSVGIVALPLAGSGLYWASYFFPVSDALQTMLSRSRLYKSQLADSLWQMCLDHPAGIGVGEEAFVAVYPAYAAPDLGAVTDSGSVFFEILLSYGWPGLILFSVVFLLFLQKSLTCLQHTAVSRDRAMILGGMVSLIGLLVFGSVRSFITAPRVAFTMVLILALCSAYENIIFDESDVLQARWEGSVQQADRFYCKGRNMYEKE